MRVRMPEKSPLFKVIEKVDETQPSTGESGNEADAFESLDALVEVAESLVGEDGDLDSIEAFDDIIENVEQVEQIAAALEEDVTLINDLKSVSEGETFDIQTAVKNSAVGKLNFVLMPSLNISQLFLPRRTCR